MSAPWPRCTATEFAKTCYPSAAKARKYARHGHDKFPDRKLRTYQCAVCGSWHLTSTPQRPNERTTS